MTKVDRCPRSPARHWSAIVRPDPRQRLNPQAIRSADPLHEQARGLPVAAHNQVLHSSGTAEDERPHRPVRLLTAIRAARPGGNLQQRPHLGIGRQNPGGQRGNLFLHLVIIDNAIHLHTQLGKPFLELR
jgi:hypothetical protein